MEVSKGKIDESVVREALRNQLSGESVEILSITNQSFSEKGLNFLSELRKVTVRYRGISKNGSSPEERSTVFVVKLEPSEEYPKSMVHQQDMFLVETRFLRDVLPVIRETIDHPVGPRLWHGCDDRRVLIMENLDEQQFSMKDRQKGLTFEHCCLVLRTMAKLHAATVAVHEKKPELTEPFGDGGIVSKKCPEVFLRLMEVSLQRIGEQIKGWSDEKCVRAAPKIIEMAKSIGEECIKAYEHDPDEFCVLNHGDCWINNIMFKENERGEPVDLRLVDYQMAVYTSPAIDLLYFLNICPEFSIIYDKDDYFVELYLNTLKETMEKINCETSPPTMQQLKRALHKRRAYAVFAGVFLHLRMIGNKEDTENFTEVLQKLRGNTRMDVFKNPDAVKLTMKMVPVMDERGYFD
ncbi:uncharacterized protein LOC143360182 [Halictus rubicundus]|uniref:uncharacterized protein LOC143360182 n=1 Tax=Halictus rubicundus TaxID=77578 RepID=UPI004037394C